MQKILEELKPKFLQSKGLELAPLAMARAVPSGTVAHIYCPSGLLH